MKTNRTVTPVVTVKTAARVTPRYKINLVDSDIWDEDTEEFEVEINNWLLSLSCRSLEFCCGVKELGGFNAGSGTTVPREEKLKAVRTLLAEIIEVNEGRTIQMELIDNAACNLVRDAVADGTLFTRVKNFKNPGSSNMISMYISNN